MDSENQIKRRGRPPLPPDERERKRQERTVTFFGGGFLFGSHRLKNNLGCDIIRIKADRDRRQDQI